MSGARFTSAFAADLEGYLAFKQNMGCYGASRIWDEAGLPRPLAGRQPVPYDFRHHFAYACIERWRIQGKDVHAMLPYLSRYMGHASFDSTYYYIHTSPDFLDAYNGITQASQDLLPEAGFG